MLSTSAKQRPLKIAIVGTRGIPANYGGFETFAEELSVRLARRGHDVTVYGRSHFIDPQLNLYRGVNVRVLPSIRRKYLETVTHTAVSVLWSLFQRYDIILTCNGANAFLCWIPRLVGQKTVLNVDGLDRLRKKWNRLGKSFYRLGEILATRLPHEVVTDARAVEQYYVDQYGFRSRFIPYGATVQPEATVETLEKLGLQPQRYLLYVGRLEPENNAHRVIQAYVQSKTALPLVVVGDAPYGRRYIRRLKAMAEGHNVLLPGAIYGHGYRELISHSFCCIHATETGGTHPALIEAMGVGNIVLVNDTPENREVVGQSALLYPFNDTEALADLMRRVCHQPDDYEPLRQRARQRVIEAYDWEKVTDQYEDLFYELARSPLQSRARKRAAQEV
ncbi:MAG: glycosyltransferase [Acidobacteriota bacterium]